MTEQSWQDVLACVEADVQRAGQLLRARSAEVAADPDSWLPADRVLPALTEMPPLPDELRERIVMLRDRICELQAELSQALAGRVFVLGTRFDSSQISADAFIARYVDRHV